MLQPPADGGTSVTDLHEVRASLLADRNARGRRFCQSFSDAVDRWLCDRFALAVADTGSTGIALIAIGGHGRRELAPASDLDLLLIHDRRRDVEPIAEALWYPIWDAGFNLDHSVRTLRQTKDVVLADIKSALSLLTGRVVCGDERLGAAVLEQGRELWKHKPRASLSRLRENLEERWRQHGELAFLLEPDVKLSRGGLRDFEALQAAAIAAPFVGEYLADPRTDDAHDRLLDVRVALHAATERRGDRLILEEQDAVARRLGLSDADELLPAVAHAARRITWNTDQVWSRIWSSYAKRAASSRTIEPGLAVRGRQLVLDGTVDPRRDSALPFRAAAASARMGFPLSATTIAKLESDTAAPSDPWPDRTRDAFVDLLGCGHDAVGVLETLDHIGVLGRYVEEWALVRSRPQRNVYHRFTVDRHLYETVAVAATLTRDVRRPDLLLVAALLHDIGKGLPGDHSDNGARLVAAIGGRMGFAPQDVSVLTSLVRNHLLLAETATRRDLGDPATIEAIAGRIGSIEELELLAALTEADSVATGPTSWTEWKADLIDELVIKTRAFLRGDRDRTSVPALTDEQRALMSEGKLRVFVEGHKVSVAAPDRRGLLATVSGVLAASGLSVRSATGLSDGPMALEIYDVDVTGRTTLDWSAIKTDILRAFDDPAFLESRLRARARSQQAPRKLQAARPGPPEVVFDNEATPRATIIEVRAPDAVGLLSKIAGALSAEGCDIDVVRALTFGREVIDTFYVTRDGRKIDSAIERHRIEDAILARLT